MNKKWAAYFNGRYWQFCHDTDLSIDGKHFATENEAADEAARLNEKLRRQQK